MHQTLLFEAVALFVEVVVSHVIACRNLVCTTLDNCYQIQHCKKFAAVTVCIVLVVCADRIMYILMSVHSNQLCLYLHNQYK